MAQDSFIFGGGTGLTYEELKQRRAIAAALASRQRGFPKTKGEGMTYLGESIGEAMQDFALRMAERRQKAGDKQALNPPEYAYPIEPEKPKKVTETTTEQAPKVDTPVVAPAPVATPAVEPWTAPEQTLAPWPVSDADTGATFDERFAAASAPPPEAVPVQTAAVSEPPPQDQSMFFSPQMAASMMTGGSSVPMDQMLALSEVPSASQQVPPDQVTLPTETRDIPLPMGDPRTTSGVRSTMEAVAARGGMTPAAIGGMERNVKDESNFNYNLRVPDQPKFSGEAHYAHGLFQEGGAEWNNMVKWINDKYPGSDWRDPKLQTEYVVERMQDPSRADYNRTFANMNAAPNSGVAADQFLRGYLKPAAQHLETRSANYLRGGGEPTYASRSVEPGGGGGAQVAGARIAPGDERTGGAPQDQLAAQRDAVTLALLNQQAQQPPSQDAAVADSRLQDVVGARRPGTPFYAPTAALGRAGVASDAPAAGLSPMGTLGAGGVDQSIEARRNAITDALQNQQPTVPEVPPENPTQPGVTTSSPTTASLPPTSGVGSTSPVSSDVVPPMGPTAQAGIPLAPPVGYAQASPVAPPPPAPRIVDTSQGVRPIPAAPEPVPYADPGPEPKQPRPTPEMLYWRGVASDPERSDMARAQAAARYKDLTDRQHLDFTNQYGLWKERTLKKQEYELGDPQRRQALQATTLANEKALRDLEGEGFVPLTKQEMAGLFPPGTPPPPAGQMYFKNRRGELKWGPIPPASTAISVDTKGETEFAKVTGKALGEHFVESLKDGQTAGVDLETITELRQRAEKVGTGASAVVQEALGRFGIKTEGLSEVQAYSALINRLTPQQRVPGTGATSDFDARMFRDSLPRLMNTPEGNRLILDTMERLAKNKMDRAEISGAVIAGTITPKEGVAKMMELQREARANSDRVKEHLDMQSKGLSIEDNQALDWATKNPNDPRSIEIRRRLGR
jgi:hypothetical protein